MRQAVCRLQRPRGAGHRAPGGRHVVRRRSLPAMLWVRQHRAARRLQIPRLGETRLSTWKVPKPFPNSTTSRHPPGPVDAGSGGQRDVLRGRPLHRGTGRWMLPAAARQTRCHLKPHSGCPQHRRRGTSCSVVDTLYLKRCLRRSRARTASPLPAGVSGAGAGHAEYEVQHAPGEQAQARPRGDVQGEVRTEVHT